MRSLLSLTTVIVMGVGAAIAGDVVPLSEAQVERIVSHTQTNFWGHAVGHDGKLLIPADADERARLLIPRGDAERVVNDAQKYGLALWCDLDWKPTYLKYMQVERGKTWNEKQIAFIGLLFGTTQGAVKQWKTNSCTEKDKLDIQQLMAAEAERVSTDGNQR